MTRTDLRRQRAASMRKAGATYQQIADALHVTRQRAQQLVRESRRATMRAVIERNARRVDDCVAAVEVSADFGAYSAGGGA